MLDSLKDLGFKYATVFGATIGVSDVIIPKEKSSLIQNADVEVKQVNDQYQSGVMTNEERYNRVVEIWSRANEKLTDLLMEVLEKDNDGFNPIYMMANSGARGSKNQIRQLSGMRGLMAKPSGDIIELPIRSNFPIDSIYFAVFKSISSLMLSINSPDIG
jgi:DNA-directed RNA polymerase subunit beta'